VWYTGEGVKPDAPELTGRTGKETFMVIIKEKKQPFEEKLEPATKQHFDLIQKQIDSDPEFKRMLTSPMKEIPQYYWLYSEIKYSLIYDISVFSAVKILYELKMSVLFSKIGNKITGFIAYKESDRNIVDIKIASFFDDGKKSNPMLAADLINFVEKEILCRDKIIWVADEKNKRANDQYVQLLNQRKFVWSREKDKQRNYMWVYTVTGKQ